MRPLDWQKWLVSFVIIVVSIGGVSYLALRPQAVTTLAVPFKDLPAYHLVTASDLVTTTVATADLPTELLISTDDLAGRYTRQPLVAKEPVTETQLVPNVDEKYLLDTTTIGIPATDAMTYNGQLKAGAIIKLWVVAEGSAAELLLDEVLVLDVQRNEGQGEGDVLPYVLILAVPEPKVEAVLTAVAYHPFWITIH